MACQDEDGDWAVFEADIDILAAEEIDKTLEDLRKQMKVKVVLYLCSTSWVTLARTNAIGLQGVQNVSEQRLRKIEEFQPTVIENKQLKSENATLKYQVHVLGSDKKDLENEKKGMIPFNSVSL